MALSFLPGVRCYGWVTYHPTFSFTAVGLTRGSSQPLCPQHYNGYILILAKSYNAYLANTGAPILSCVHRGVPGIFMDCHMMVSQPEKVILHCFIPASVILSITIVG